MKKGKHVLMHKPIANRLYEGRLVLKTARQAKVATHLLAYGSGTGNGLIAERIKEGVIGPLREVHNWRNPPVWPQYTEIPSDRPPVPKGFEWDLWLGPAVFRPYHPHYTHTVFRGWYDFGGGSMADMGIYSLWPVFTALNLSAPLSAEAWATHTCSIVDNVSRPVDNDFSYPTGCTLRFQFAARQDMPALDLFWYDGGMKHACPMRSQNTAYRLTERASCSLAMREQSRPALTDRTRDSLPKVRTNLSGWTRIHRKAAAAAQRAVVIASPHGSRPSKRASLTRVTPCELPSGPSQQVVDTTSFTLMQVKRPSAPGLWAMTRMYRAAIRERTKETGSGMQVSSSIAVLIILMPWRLIMS